MKVSILRVTTPLVSPAETTLTECGKLLSENGPVTSDPGVPCDLGTAVASVYERGAYASQIDYGQPLPPPPLSQAEADWLTALLQHT